MTSVNDHAWCDFIIRIQPDVSIPMFYMFEVLTDKVTYLLLLHFCIHTTVNIMHEC